VTEFTGLIAARQNVGPSAQNAINAALAGRLLTGDQRTALRGALEKGNLTPSQKGAIAAALQSDLDEKRLLAASGGRVTDLDNGGFNPETVDPAVVSNDGGYIPAPTESAVVNAPNSGIQTASFTPQPDNGNRALPLQEGRRLRVENKTNRVLTVYVQTQDMTQPVRYSFDAGRTATITTAQGPLVAKHLWVWAESGPREWLENKENALILAAEAYQAVEPEVRTISFE